MHICTHGVREARATSKTLRQDASRNVMLMTFLFLGVPRAPNNNGATFLGFVVTWGVKFTMLLGNWGDLCARWRPQNAGAKKSLWLKSPEWNARAASGNDVTPDWFSLKKQTWFYPKINNARELRYMWYSRLQEIYCLINPLLLSTLKHFSISRDERLSLEHLAPEDGGLP